MCDCVLVCVYSIDQHHKDSDLKFETYTFILILLSCDYSDEEGSDGVYFAKSFNGILKIRPDLSDSSSKTTSK